jgi:hypothetical protein
MKALEMPFNPYQFPALIEPIASDGPMNGQRVRLYYSTGWIDALTWADLPAGETPTVCAAQVTVVELPTKPARYLLMHCQPQAALASLDLLPDNACPLPGVLTQIKTLVAGIASQALRKMLTHALLHPDAVLGYWRAPASLNDHHNFVGGLARHSLEVATMVASSSLLSKDDLDLGISMALLHDYGKIWCYRDGKYTTDHKRGHEVVGLEKLAPHLDILRRDNPEIGGHLYELLSGLCQRKDKRYPLAIGRVVHAFDQMSCEMTRRATVSELEDVPF